MCQESDHTFPAIVNSSSISPEFGLCVLVLCFSFERRVGDCQFQKEDVGRSIDVAVRCVAVFSVSVQLQRSGDIDNLAAVLRYSLMAVMDVTAAR